MKQDYLDNLKKHQESLRGFSMKEAFKNDPKRFEKFYLEAPFLSMDYSKNLITEETMSLLVALAKSCDLTKKISTLMCAGWKNITEHRMVLHTILRDINSPPIDVDGQDVTPWIRGSLKKMTKFVDAIHQGTWKGMTGKPITDIVNIGIGGSDLGPKMACAALTAYDQKKVRCHFVSNIDNTQIKETLENLNPETTLFCLASKTFTTQETLTNAELAKDWMRQKIKGDTTDMMQKHFVALTANPKKASEYGLPASNIFEFWDWVGGRFSLWSVIGLPIALSIGMKNFKAFLTGALELDRHFWQTPLEKNAPVLMALLSFWYRQFWNTASHAVIPYAHALQYLPNYLQQLMMESNGKSTTLDGTFVNYPTESVIWGGVGTDGQHAFHQLLHQGTDLIPIDFIATLSPTDPQHELLFANCLAQSRALLIGKTEKEAYEELLKSGMDETEAKKLAPHKAMPGNRPSTTILLSQLTPESLGALIALYEHQVFVEGVLWNINSFDQFGVELGKTIAKQLADYLHSKDKSTDDLDSSTAGIIELYRKANV